MRVIINCRDRVTLLRGMVEWLEQRGVEDIVLIDNASTYEPLLDYYRASPHHVHLLDSNVGHMALYWAAPQFIPNEPFVYSDPDLILPAPQDSLEVLAEVASRHPEIDKVGFGLDLIDLPLTAPQRGWEESMYVHEVEPGVYKAPIDTTFAIHNSRATDIWNSLRLGAPHIARHPSWGQDRYALSDEDYYYLTHAGNSSSWKQSLEQI